MNRILGGGFRQEEHGGHEEGRGVFLDRINMIKRILGLRETGEGTWDR